jgi:type I restriction enzyme, S subunit
MINEDWPKRPLGELFGIGAGKTMSAAAREGDDKTPFLRTSNVLWDEIDLTTVDKMAISAHELQTKLLLPGDLLVCEGGEIGRAAIWNGEVERMSFQNHLHRLRPLADDVEPRFYVYFLQCAFTQLGIFEGAGNKTTIPNLSRNRLAALEVPHPEVNEQRDIVLALARVREAIKLHDRSTELAEDLKRAAMQSLFTHGMKGESTKETEIGPVPESWRIGPLGQLAQFQRGFDITKSEQASGGIPVISSGGIKSFHNVAAAKGPGIVIGRKGSIGLLHYVETDYWPHDTTLWCVDYLGNVPKFVFYRLHSIDMKRLDSGAANPALNRNFLHKETVSWPEPGEQREIVTVLDAIDCKIDLHRRKRVALNDLFKGLLHKLMTGEIRARDLDRSAIDPNHTTSVAG